MTVGHWSMSVRSHGVWLLAMEACVARERLPLTYFITTHTACFFDLSGFFSTPEVSRNPLVVHHSANSVIALTAFVFDYMFSIFRMMSISLVFPVNRSQTFSRSG